MRPKCRAGSDLQPSQREVYVRFERFDAIESLLASVKCVYHINNPIGRSGSPGIFSNQFGECAFAQLRGESGVSNRPGVSSCPYSFLYHAGTSRILFQPYACNFWVCGEIRSYSNDILWSIKHVRSKLEYTQKGMRTYFSLGFTVYC